MAGYIRQSSFIDGDTITAALFNNEYNQLVNAFSNTSGHKHDGTTAEGPVIGLIGDAGETSPNNKVLIDTTNNYIEFYVEVSSAPVQQLYIADGAIIPVTDNDIDLGTSSLEFKNIYIDGTATIDTLTVDEAATVGTTLGVTGATTLSSTLAVTGTSTLTGNVTTTNDLSVGGNLTVTGNATISGNLTFGDADTDSINLAAEIDSNIVPNTDDTYDLGTTTKEWRNLYIDGTANIDSLVADTADINGGTIDGATIATSDITVGAGKTLDVSAGTLTLADDQISGDKVEGGTIAATTITTLTSTTGNITNVNATTVDSTNLEVTNLKAKDGTSAGSIADTTGVVTLASSVLTTTDINGGTIDGVTIGGSSAGAVTFTDLSDGTITIAGFADEDNMVSDSATLLPTQQSVKAYVDAQVTAQDLDFQGDTGGALSIDLDSESLTIAGGTGIDTSGATNTLTVAIDSTVATLTGTQTLTNKTLTTPIISSISNTGTLTLPTSTDTLVGRATTDTLTNKTLTSPDVNTPDIDGGTIDGTVIGGATPAAADFTTMDTTGNASVGGNLSVTGDLTINGTTTTVNSTTVTIDDPIFTLGGDTAPASDDNKDRGIEFRWHNGTAAKVGFFGYDDSASVFTFIPDATNTSEVFSGSAGNVAFGNIAGTLATAAQPNITSLGTLTGLDVAGTPTFDGLTVDGTSALNGNTSIAGTLAHSSSGGLSIKIGLNNASISSSTDCYIGTHTSGGMGSTSGDMVLIPRSNANSAVQIVTGNGTPTKTATFGYNGDISFYDDTGTSQALFWDASAESLGIGTTNPTAKLVATSSAAGAYGAIIYNTSATGEGLTVRGGSTSSQNALVVQDYNGANALLNVRSDGNVGIGTSSPSSELHMHVTGASNGAQILFDSDYGTGYVGQENNTSNNLIIGSSSAGITFYAANAQKMVLDSSGSLLVNSTSAGSSRLKVVGDASRYGILSENLSGYGAFSLKSTTVAQTWSIGAVDNSSNSDLFIYGGSSAGTKVTLDSSGNVGIGTTSPATRLDITADNTAINSKGTVFIGSESTWGVDKGGQLSLGGRYTDSVTEITYGNISGRKENGTAGSGNGYLAFGTSANNGVLTERMRIDSSGNVGIGVTNPTSYYSRSLVVSATAEQGITIAATGTSMSNYLMFADGTTGNEAYRGYIAYSHTNDKMAFATAGTEKMFIDSSGKIGIGTTDTSNAKLVINGNVTSGAETAMIDFDGYGTYGTNASQTINFRMGRIGQATDQPAQIIGLFEGGGATAAATSIGFVFKTISANTQIDQFKIDAAYARFKFNTSESPRSNNPQTNNCLVIGPSTSTAVTAGLTNATVLINRGGELYAVDSSHNNTQLTPHNWTLIPEGPSEELAWTYWSQRPNPDNPDQLQGINVDMAKVARKVEDLVGEKLVYTENSNMDDHTHQNIIADIQSTLADLTTRIEALEG